jgi:DNA invertase Pin-like site-specific DNA recombinase
MELSDRARELRNAAARKYRKEHPEKIREYNIFYWEKKADPVGANVRKLSAKGISQRNIAKQLNISLGTVNAILNAE